MGRGSGASGARGGGGGGGSRSIPTAEQKAAAQKELKSLKAPKMGASVSMDFNGRTGTITRVQPGYRTVSGSNTMFRVSVWQGSENVFWTNRRGSSAFSEAKDDLRIYLGLK